MEIQNGQARATIDVPQSGEPAGAGQTRLADAVSDPCGSDERFRVMAEICRDMLAICDDRGKLLWTNNLCSAFVGAPWATPLEAMKRINPNDIPSMQAVFGTIDRRGFTDVELRVRNAQGEMRTLLVSIRKIIHDGKEFLFVCGHDITDRKLALAATQELKRQLAASSAGPLNVARLLSHDLRATLQTIVSYCELLGNGFGGELNEKGLAYLQTVLQTAHGMSGLVQRVLERSGFSDAPAKEGPRSNPPVNNALGSNAPSADLDRDRDEIRRRAAEISE